MVRKCLVECICSFMESTEFVGAAFLLLLGELSHYDNIWYGWLVDFMTRLLELSFATIDYLLSLFYVVVVDEMCT